MDLADAGFVDISRVSFLVLDEADRMLDMGFGEDIKQILDRIQPDRQACMWTATWPKSVCSYFKTITKPNYTTLRSFLTLKQVDRLAKDYFGDYARVNVGSSELTANPKIDQIVEVTNLNGKLHKLMVC